MGDIGADLQRAYDEGYEQAKKDCGIPEGKWIDISDGGRIKYIWYEKYMCNKCGARGTSAWPFCPNCGARMDGKEQAHEPDRP